MSIQQYAKCIVDENMDHDDVITHQFHIDRPFISFADMASSIYDHKIFDATADSTAIEFTVVSAPNNCIQREMPYEIYTFAM